MVNWPFPSNVTDDLADHESLNDRLTARIVYHLRKLVCLAVVQILAYLIAYRGTCSTGAIHVASVKPQYMYSCTGYGPHCKGVVNGLPKSRSLRA